MANNEKKIGFTCQLPIPVYETLKEMAEQNKVSISYLIRQAIDEYLESFEVSEE